MRALVTTKLVALATMFMFCMTESVNELFGQTDSTNSTNLKYSNDQLGFTLQHPSNWKIDERTSSGIVNLAGENDHPIMAVDVKEVPRDTLTLKNSSFEQLAVQEKTNFYSHLFGPSYKVLSEKPITIGNISGIKLEYTTPGKYSYDVFFTGNGKLYSVAYVDSPSNVPETVKVANKVLESFQIVK